MKSFVSVFCLGLLALFQQHDVFASPKPHAAGAQGKLVEYSAAPAPAVSIGGSGDFVGISNMYPSPRPWRPHIFTHLNLFALPQPAVQIACSLVLLLSTLRGQRIFLLLPGPYNRVGRKATPGCLHLSLCQLYASSTRARQMAGMYRCGESAAT